jgi:alpha-ketoglutarate-dependent taurine dioxygenase
MMVEPPMGALLYALEVLPAGGDTLLASPSLVYERLSDSMNALIEPRKCIHSDRNVAGPSSPFAKAKRSTKAHFDDAWREPHNVHPETGRRCLFVHHSYSVRLKA